MGREKFLKSDFFNYIKIKNHKKQESGKTKQKIRKGMKTKFRNKLQLSNSLRLKITRIDVTSMPPSTVTGNKRANHTRLIMRNRSRFL
jgi:hypothetical protein